MRWTHTVNRWTDKFYCNLDLETNCIFESFISNNIKYYEL